MSLPTSRQGIVTWTPLAGRIESGCAPSSRRRSSSAHTPVADTTTRARTWMSPSPVSTTAPSMRPSAPCVNSTHRAAVGDDRAVLRRSAGDRQREPCVVGGGVVVDEARRQPIGGQRRAMGERLLGVEPAMELADPGAAGEVVHPERRAHRLGDLLRDRPVLGEDRHEERQHGDEMGRVAEQPLALVERLVDEPHVALLQVAQAAVHELRALRRRAGREVVALDERGAQAPGDGVEGDPAAGDAAADDEHVELAITQLLDHRRPLERDHRGRVGERVHHAARLRARLDRWPRRTRR